MNQGLKMYIEETVNRVKTVIEQILTKNNKQTLKVTSFDNRKSLHMNENDDKSVIEALENEFKIKINDGFSNTGFDLCNSIVEMSVNINKRIKHESV